MDRGGSLKLLCLLSIIIIELDLALGRPKCTGRWAIHSCGGGNGKRSDVPSDDESLPENRIAGFESPILKVLGGGRNGDETYGSQVAEDEEEEEDSSFKESISQLKEKEFEDRLQGEWQALVRRLLKEKTMEDNEDQLERLLRSL